MFIPESRVGGEKMARNGHLKVANIGKQSLHVVDKREIQNL